MKKQDVLKVLTAHFTPGTVLKVIKIAEGNQNNVYVTDVTFDDGIKHDLIHVTYIVKNRHGEYDQFHAFEDPETWEVFVVQDEIESLDNLIIQARQEAKLLAKTRPGPGGLIGALIAGSEPDTPSGSMN